MAEDRGKSRCCQTLSLSAHPLVHEPLGYGHLSSHPSWRGVAGQVPAMPCGYPGHKCPWTEQRTSLRDSGTGIWDKATSK